MYEGTFTPLESSQENASYGTLKKAKLPELKFDVKKVFTQQIFFFYFDEISELL